ncbi:phosphotransferase [Homoserinibacter sp. YIM 151385]|uniref:phosphotransferase n=1 Tax=Homoserinibacter sp. YIM 151385 TaxID=2985506 RepID=UPI0022F04778|nr:phosphotransferase [Homoserinibacter sp. YIM 151385]WBU37569.1 phosphotransferase [Homoserinibacter sp. YIM 151385]
MPTPTAEVPVTVELIERLVASQHPDLLGEVRIAASGWDNVVARLGEAHAVRLPRRALAAPLVEHEARWLPEIAEHLPVRVPAAVRLGSPEGEYPWTWLIVPWIEGTAVVDLPLARRGRVAAELGAAHAALHRPAPADAPANPVRGVPLASRVEVAEQRLTSGILPRATELRRVWEAALDAPEHAGSPRWLHGDAHPGNLLAESGPHPDPALAALIDFGDLTAGDPASDLAVGWLAFDAAGRAAYRAAYEASAEADEATWMRARGWAALLAGAFLGADDDPRMSGIGRHAVRELLDADDAAGTPGT